MIPRKHTLFPLMGSIALLTTTSAQAEDTTIPVYGIIAASIAAITLGEMKGTSVLDTFTSGTQQRQLSLTTGEQDANLHINRLAYRWEHQQGIWQNDTWKLSSALEASYGYWQIDRPFHPNRNQDIGLTPLFKWQYRDLPNWYAEVGVGMHLLENIQVKTDNKSTQFQFGDQFGLGWENQHVRLGYHYLHISNANIATPNPATDFHSVSMGYRF